MQLDHVNASKISEIEDHVKTQKICAQHRNTAVPISNIQKQTTMIFHATLFAA